jgi:hypothetical protein
VALGMRYRTKPLGNKLRTLALLPLRQPLSCRRGCRAAALLPIEYMVLQACMRHVLFGLAAPARTYGARKGQACTSLGNNQGAWLLMMQLAQQHSWPRPRCGHRVCASVGPARVRSSFCDDSNVCTLYAPGAVRASRQVCARDGAWSSQQAQRLGVFVVLRLHLIIILYTICCRM